MQDQEQSATGLSSHVASTLAYCGVWLSGIVFLALETKDKTVRFNAMQSVVTFGLLLIVLVGLSSLGTLFGLGIWGGALRPLELTFTIVQSLLVAFSIVLWILLMVRSYRAERTVLPLAGELSLRFLSRLDGSAPDLGSSHGVTAAAEKEETRDAGARRTWEERRFRRGESGAGRIAGSIAAIVWSIVLFILFNFYAGHIAFYQGVSSDGVTQLLRYPVLTTELTRVLPILNATLGVTVIGHAVVLSVDSSAVRQVVQIVAHAMGVVTTVVFLRVFPFDFSDLPFGDAVEVFPSVTIGVLTVIAVVMGIETIVRLIRLVTHLSWED